MPNNALQPICSATLRKLLKRIPLGSTGHQAALPRDEVQ